MKNIISLVVMLATATASAQEGTFFPMREGAVLEYSFLDAKGKTLRDAWRNERFTRLTVQQVWGDTLANVLIENEALARTKEPLPTQYAEAVRWGDVMIKPQEVLFDNVLWWYAPERYTGRADVDVSVSVNSSMSLPRTLHEGDTLPDLVHRSEIVEISTNGDQGQLSDDRNADLLNMLELQGDHDAIAQLGKSEGNIYTMTATQRRVAGREKITTPAGDFDCWRIEYELLGPLRRRQGMPAAITVFREEGAPARIELQFDDNNNKQLVPYADYYSPMIGLVRRDRLSASGRRIEESMVLTSEQ